MLFADADENWKLNMRMTMYVIFKSGMKIMHIRPGYRNIPNVAWSSHRNERSHWVAKLRRPNAKLHLVRFPPQVSICFSEWLVIIHLSYFSVKTRQLLLCAPSDIWRGDWRKIFGLKWLKYLNNEVMTFTVSICDLNYDLSRGYPTFWLW